MKIMLEKELINGRQMTVTGKTIWAEFRAGQRWG
jgi:hypothetical protein